MSQIETTDLLNDLLQQDATQVQAWLNSVWAGQQQVPEGFHWHGLAEGAAFRARGESNLTFHLPNIEWAKVSTSVYDFLAENQHNPNSRDSFKLSSMMLRAFMIKKNGVVAGDPILDADQIINWFLTKLDVSYDEALIKATAWREFFQRGFKDSSGNKKELHDIEVKEILKLRLIKNRLAVIEALAESDQFQPNEELSAWLSLRDKLP